MKTRTICWVLSAAVGCIAGAAEPPLREQFAYAMPLYVPAGEPVVSLSLPAAVYRDCVDSGLRDLRVLNAAGEVVPYALRRPPAMRPGVANAVRVPLFPVRGAASSDAAALQLSLSEGRAQLEVQAAAPDGAPPIAAWLLDARALEVPVDSLTWEWASDAADFSTRVQLEASDDLQNWRTMASAAPLARLRHAGEVFEQRTMTFPPVRANYWRLRATDGVPLPAFTAVRATPVANETPVERQRADASGSAQPGNPGDYRFDLGAQLPVERLELLLPDLNTVAQVEVFSRRDPDDEWQTVARGAVYRLQAAGGEVVSPALPVDGRPRRLWRVAVDERGGGIGRGIPTLRAEWLPDQLVFVTRGAGPFELVYGSYTAPAADVALGSLLPAGKGESFDAATLPLAQAAEPREAGGRDRLEAPPPDRPWRTWALWAALLGGVATLGVLAWNLARQMRASN
jgi:hypothetical protein